MTVNAAQVIAKPPSQLPDEFSSQKGDIMAMTSKQRAYLKSLASNITPIFQVGKASLTPEMVIAVDEALEKRELIKLSVLKNCFDDPKEIAETLAERTRSQVVHVIGKKIVLFRPAKKDSKIQLPK